MIGYVTALPAEAGPLVRHYRMERFEDAFTWYRSDEVALVVSGVGKSAAAAATAYLHARTGERPFNAWLNVGIAGHRHRAPGDLLVAHTVTDAASGKRWYPVRLGGPSLEPVEVRTVDRAETRFDPELDVAYEMEASGVFPTAVRWSTAELVHAIKVVSDNLETGFVGLSAKTIRDLIESRLPEVTAMADHCRELAAELEPLRTARVQALVEAYRERYRFTTSEARRLRRLLLRWEALDPEGEHGPETGAAGGTERAEELFARLVSRVVALGAERGL